jgi:hypothetical protein
VELAGVKYCSLSYKARVRIVYIFTHLTWYNLRTTNSGADIEYWPTRGIAFVLVIAPLD